MHSGKGTPFSPEYSDYWKKLTQAPAAKTGVPDTEVASAIIRELLGEREKNEVPVLDAACGSGRLFNTLSALSLIVDGVELEESAAQEARTLGYRKVTTGPVENYSVSSHYGLIVCWAAFEVLNQAKALDTFYSASQQNGRVLLTGKSANYCSDDKEALRAEAGAKSKAFRQFFVDTRVFCSVVTDFGFEIVRSVTFEKRGDFSAGRYASHDSLIPESQFYEFAVLLEKRFPQKESRHSSTPWSHDTSTTFRKRDGVTPGGLRLSK